MSADAASSRPLHDGGLQLDVLSSRALPAKLQRLAATWPSGPRRLAEYLATRPHDRPPDTAFPTVFSYGGECAVCQQRTQPMYAVVRRPHGWTHP